MDMQLAVSAPEENAYVFLSRGVMQMLNKKLLDKCIRERTALEKEDVRAAYRKKLKTPKHDLESSSDEDEPQKSDEDDNDDSHNTDN